MIYHHTFLASVPLNFKLNGFKNIHGYILKMNQKA
ncbi:hypothetical protein PR048_002951 [Dryococelus australis]|uniref:Cytochrome b n=1 Tax=Dryococelus australis TaxID=614101 RepID=A0ABQ9ILQ4_9NEOP|nr:hypothetical protein PR048_002951 [Dryococelus australis]